MITRNVGLVLALTASFLLGVFFFVLLSSRPSVPDGPSVYVDLGMPSDAKGQDISQLLSKTPSTPNNWKSGGELFMAGPCGLCTRTKTEETPTHDSRGRPIIIVIENPDMAKVLTKLGKTVILDAKGKFHSLLAAKFPPRRYFFDSTLHVTVAETGNMKEDTKNGFDPD